MKHRLLLLILFVFATSVAGWAQKSTAPSYTVKGRGDKTEQLQELDGSGLPVDGRTEIRHCKRRHAAKPRTGRRRPETSGATRRRARRLPQHPATVTEGKGQARDLPGQTVKNEVL